MTEAVPATDGCSGEDGQDKPFSKNQLFHMASVYELMARALPTEGRDFSIKFKFSGDNEMSVSMNHYTEIGRIWCDYVNKLLRKACKS